MVDIHSHILPFVDDGSKDLQTSFEMLKAAEHSGTSEIVLTPHSNLYDNEKNYLYEMQLVFDAFKKKVEQQGIDIKLYLGGEIFVDDSILNLMNKNLLPTINGSRFMIVEFDFYTPAPYITEKVKAISHQGIVPIVAHPERYECIKRVHSISLDIMNNGGLLQVNKGSLAGEFGAVARQTAFELIYHKTAQFIASDAHSISSRTPEMELEYDIVCNDFDELTAKKLFETNPKRVIENDKLIISRPVSF